MSGINNVVDIEAVGKLGAVNIAFDAADAAFAGVLPHDVFVAVAYAWSIVLIEGYKEWVVLKTAVGYIFVVEVDIGVQDGWTAIVFLHSLQEPAQPAGEGLYSYTVGTLHVNDGHQVLVGGINDGYHVAELGILVNVSPVEMVASHIDAILTCLCHIIFVIVVNEGHALGSLDIGIADLAGGGYGSPIDGALVVGHVNTSGQGVDRSMG